MTPNLFLIYFIRKWHMQDPVGLGIALGLSIQQMNKWTQKAASAMPKEDAVELLSAFAKYENARRKERGSSNFMSAADVFGEIQAAYPEENLGGVFKVDLFFSQQVPHHG